MKQLSRVVWSEGMYLGPHHFQVQGRYFEDSIRFATSSLWFEPWGLAGCELDSEALINGTISVLHARGIFPDGLPFHMPQHDPLPPTRNIADEFPMTRDRVTVFLTIPARRENGVNCVPKEEAGPTPVRFLAEQQMLFDETTGRDEKAVRLGRKNIQIALDLDNPDPAASVAIARVMRDGSGNFVFDPSFVPPCVQVAASERVLSILQRLIDILDDKSRSLGRGKSGSASLWSEYSTAEIATFWMLHSVNSALAPLRHHLRVKRGHPEELYSELARLAGALCTFSVDHHPSKIPLYKHRELDKTFEELDSLIRFLLETMVPTQYIQIPLEKSAEYFFNGAITDQRVLNPSKWILSIRSPAIEPDVIRKTPQLAKLCSTAFVPKLVERALPGLPLIHMPVPPSAIRSRVDAQYFTVTCKGPCWESVSQTRQIGLYIPGDIPDPKPELYVILES
ncbi:MAG TPA: type VI secretion system baseplate subunit TssK [Bryobacteraceae bacterium]|nr:type VI secretion system baseplate subunit TssK [Bryobacteraceae bacterium]